MKSVKPLSIFFLLLSLVCFGSSNLKQTQINGLNPIKNLRIDTIIEKGVNVDFQIARPERYFLWLNLKTSDEDRLCGLIKDSNLNCGETTPELGVDYKIFESGKTVKESAGSPYSLELSNDESRLVLGEFLAPNSGTYSAEIILKGNLESLKTLGATLQIGVHTLDYQGDLILGAILLYAGYISFGFFALLMCCFLSGKYLTKLPQHESARVF